MQKQIQTLKQQLKISPLQLQFYGLLELNTHELSDKITKEVEENPALEEFSNIDNEHSSEEDVFSTESDYTDDFDSYNRNSDSYSDYDEEYDHNPKEWDSHPSSYSVLKDSPTLIDSLLLQFHDRQITEKERAIGDYIIGNIDEDGYLRQEMISIADDLLFRFGIDASEAEIEEVLGYIQECDPSGVGARNLRENLLIQLGRKKATEAASLAYLIIDRYYDEFAKKQFEKISNQLNIDTETLRDAIEEIAHLNPKPANGWEDPGINQHSNEITPDFIIEEQNGGFSIQLNQKELPSLRVSESFLAMINDYQGNDKNHKQEIRDAITYTKQKIESARWFINALKQRQETLLKVMESIVAFQMDFFISGDESTLRPMILEDIANKTGLNISTISRINSCKYAQTPWGIFSLKHFFVEKRQNAEGDELSIYKINKQIHELIANESKDKPLTDEELANQLISKGYNLARRTVAKYRENLGLPVARLRKRI